MVGFTRFAMYHHSSNDACQRTWAANMAREGVFPVLPITRCLRSLRELPDSG